MRGRGVSAARAPSGNKGAAVLRIFAAPLPGQRGRTVFIILLEEVPGRDLRVIVPPDDAGNVCAKHKNAIIDAALHLFFDILACCVNQQDMYSRNVFLWPQKRVSLSVPGERFCDTKECLLALEVDCDELHMVMVDFEMVDFKEPKRAVRRKQIERVKSMYLRRRLENGL